MSSLSSSVDAWMAVSWGDCRTRGGRSRVAGVNQTLPFGRAFPGGSLSHPILWGPPLTPCWRVSNTVRLSGSGLALECYGLRDGCRLNSGGSVGGRGTQECSRRWPAVILHTTTQVKLAITTILGNNSNTVFRWVCVSKLIYRNVTKEIFSRPGQSQGLFYKALW